MKNNSIILFGPMSVGKTSISKKLAELLDYDIVHADILRDLYYLKFGLAKDKVKEIRQNGFAGYVEFMRPYELKFVEEVLREYGDYKVIFDFGAGFSYYTDEDDIQKFAKMLENYQNIFLLLPNGDFEISNMILSERIRKECQSEGVEESKIQDTIKLNEEFIRSKSSMLVAKNLIYTNTDTVEEIVSKIKLQINSNQII